MLTETARCAAEWAAARTVNQFFLYLDRRDYAAAAALFASDGYWTRMAQRLVGPAEIAAALAARPATLATRHLLTNMVAEHDGDGVDARYYITVYEDAMAGAAPGRLGSPGAIFASHDRLRQTDSGWRFVSRDPVLHFKKSPDGT